jgi:S-adenosyl methyltransferase
MTEHTTDDVEASPSGMYDHLLGGTTNTAADSGSVDTLLESLPEIRDGAEADRGSLRRAVRYLAEQGIDQFIDPGSGPPTRNNTDEVAQRVNPGDGRPEQSVRSWEEIESLYDGLEMLPAYDGSGPKLVHLGEWGSEDPAQEDSDGSRCAYCAVALRP